MRYAPTYFFTGNRGSKPNGTRHLILVQFSGMVHSSTWSILRRFSFRRMRCSLDTALRLVKPQLLRPLVLELNLGNALDAEGTRRTAAFRMNAPVPSSASDKPGMRGTAKDVGADGQIRPPGTKGRGRRAFGLGELSGAKVEAVIENVSARGARLITNSMCAPGKLVRLDAPEEHLSLPARVIYCKRLGENKFAVGLRLNVRVEKWEKPPKA